MHPFIPSQAARRRANAQNALVALLEFIAFILLIAAFVVVWSCLPDGEALAAERAHARVAQDSPLLVWAVFVAIAAVMVWGFRRMSLRCAARDIARWGVSLRMHMSERMFGMLLLCIGAIGALTVLGMRAMGAPL